MTTLLTGMASEAVGYGEIVAGQAVQAGMWRRASMTVNTLNAMGGQLVVSNRLPPMAPGTHTIRYWAWPRAIHTDRVWVLRFNGKAVLTAQDADASEVSAGFVDKDDAVFVDVRNEIRLDSARLYHADYAATTTPHEVTLTITVGVGTSVRGMEVACFEVPRPTVTLGTGEVASGRVAPGSQIMDTAESSIVGVAAAAEHGRVHNTRANFHWWNPVGVQAFSSTPVGVFALPPKCLARAMRAQDGAVCPVSVRVYAGSTDGGEVAVTAESGDSVAIAVPAGSPAWYSGTLEIDRENYANAAGGQTGREFGDTLAFTVAQTGGEFETCTVYGLAVGEQAP